MNKRTEFVNLEKLSEIIIETIKELSTVHQQALTAPALGRALAGRKGFAELLRWTSQSSYRDLGPTPIKTLKREPAKPSPMEAAQDGEVPGTRSPLAVHTRKLRDFRFQLLNESLDNLTREHLDRASDLRENIRTCEDPERLIEMNEEILSLLQLAFRNVGGEIAQFTHLVEAIGKNLLAMEADILSTSSTTRETFHQNSEFNNLVESDVREIRESIQLSRNLRDFQQFLLGKLEGIRLSIERKRQHDAMLLSKAQQEIDGLKNNLHEMQLELSRVQTEAQSLEKEVLLDPLTGIHNRRAYEKRLLEEFAHYKSLGHCFSMLMIDIDHFKRVNDQYGHRAGDRCLQEFTKLVKHILRGADFLARYGGEEFVVILPGTDAKGIGIVSEKIRHLVEKARFTIRDKSIPITVSIGGSHARPEDTNTESIFNRVDTALYKAKQTGRNRVVLL